MYGITAPYHFKLSQRSDTVMIDSLVKEIQWDKAVSYYDEIKLQYVIEVPIIQKIDYAYMIPWNGLSYHPTTYEQKNKRSLIIVQDDSLNMTIFSKGTSLNMECQQVGV